MKDNILFKRFLEDQSKLASAEQPPLPQLRAGGPSKDSSLPDATDNGPAVDPPVKSISFTPSMFGYDDIDADSSVSQDNRVRKPLRLPPRVASGEHSRGNGKPGEPRFMRSLSPLGPSTRLPQSPSKADGETLDQVRRHVRENRTERKRDNRARRLGRPVSKGGKSRHRPADAANEARTATAGDHVVKGKAIKKSGNQEQGEMGRSRQPSKKYHEALVHDAAISGKPRLTLPKGIFDRAKAGVVLGDLDFSKLKPPPPPSPLRVRDRADMGLSSHHSAKPPSVQLSGGAAGSSRITCSPLPLLTLPMQRTASPQRVLSIHGSCKETGIPSLSSPDVPMAGVVQVAPQSQLPGVMRLSQGIPATPTHNLSRTLPADTPFDSHPPPNTPPFSYPVLETAHLPNPSDPEMDLGKGDDVLSELHHIARQVPDYGRRHSSTRPDTRDTSLVHLVGDPTLIVAGHESALDYGFTERSTMMDVSNADPSSLFPTVWTPNPVSSFSSAKRPFLHLPPHQKNHLFANRSSLPVHLVRPSTSQTRRGRTSPGSTFMAPAAAPRFGSVQPSDLPRSASRGWSHV